VSEHRQHIHRGKDEGASASGTMLGATEQPSDSGLVMHRLCAHCLQMGRVVLCCCSLWNTERVPGQLYCCHWYAFQPCCPCCCRCVCFTFSPQHPDSRVGQDLLRVAAAHLGAPLTRVLRVRMILPQQLGNRWAVCFDSGLGHRGT